MGDFILISVLSIFIGGMVGFEREISRRPAGLRTHMLVCLGASIVMYLNIDLISDFPGLDPGRLSANVVTGIGFLGAGTILKGDDTVSGLTTAASLWTVATIGLLIGSERYMHSLIAAFLVFFVLRIISVTERKIEARIKNRYRINLGINSISLDEIERTILDIFPKSSATLELMGRNRLAIDVKGLEKNSVYFLSEKLLELDTVDNYEVKRLR